VPAETAWLIRLGGGQSRLVFAARAGAAATGVGSEFNVNPGTLISDTAPYAFQGFAHE